MEKESYTLTFLEAVEACLKEKGFIRGNNFAKGVYVKRDNLGLLVVIDVNEKGWHEKIRDFYINDSTVFHQKYKLFSVASKKELELEG